MSEISEREIEIIKRHRRLRDDLRLSPLEGIHWVPNVGSIMTNFDPSDRSRFEAYVKKLIHDGVPQVTHASIHHYHKQDDGHTAYPFWHVHNVPSKKGKAVAEAWMRHRGLQWDGGAGSLRAEVERALILGETIPRCGLYIRLAIFVKDPR